MNLIAAVEVTAERLPERWQWLTDYTIAGNEVWRLLALLAAVLVLVLAGRLLRYVLDAASVRARLRGRELVAAAFRALARATGFAAFVVGLYVGLAFLKFGPIATDALSTVTAVLGTLAVGYTAICLVSVVDQWLRDISSKTPSKLDDMMVPLVRTSLQGTIIVLVLVQIATNLSGETATSIVAGLGVGGLAVGLAAQDTIKNFFGSMMIFGDRPFEMGDEISVDSLSGKVETVGFRSTRFRTGDGHVVTIPNGELANKPIVNISRRQSLQRKLELALSHEVSEEKMLAAIEIVQQILAGHEGQTADKPPRVFFSDITPTALNLQVMYWYTPPDWWRFMALNQRINLDILRRFDEAGIQFASRTQRLLVSAEAVDSDGSATAEKSQSDTRK